MQMHKEHIRYIKIIGMNEGFDTFCILAIVTEWWEDSMEGTAYARKGWNINIEDSLYI